MADEQKRGRGRPRKHDNRQQAWKERTGFEQSPERRAKKAEWARASRAKKKAAKKRAEQQPPGDPN